MRTAKSKLITAALAACLFACDAEEGQPEEEPTMLIELCQAAARAECGISISCNELGEMTKEECIDWNIQACCTRNGYSKWATCMHVETELSIERGWSCQDEVMGLGCVMDANQASCLQLCDDLSLVGWHICNDLDDWLYTGWEQ
jgi:hypothetical protein